MRQNIVPLGGICAYFLESVRNGRFRNVWVKRGGGVRNHIFAESEAEVGRCYDFQQSAHTACTGIALSKGFPNIPHIPLPPEHSAGTNEGTMAPTPENPPSWRNSGCPREICMHTYIHYPHWETQLPPALQGRANHLPGSCRDPVPRFGGGEGLWNLYVYFWNLYVSSLDTPCPPALSPTSHCFFSCRSHQHRSSPPRQRGARTADWWAEWPLRPATHARTH